MNHTKIKSAMPGDTLRDIQVPGLHLRAFEKRKSFYLYFRTKTGKERRPKIGDFPTITLDQARKIAKELLLQVASGIDPLAERDRKKAALSVDEIWPRYIEEHASKKKTGKEDERMYRASVPAWFKALPILDVEYTHTYKLHQELKAAPYQANRVLSMLAKFFNLCEKWKLRPQGSDPCKYVPRFKEEKRRRYMTQEERNKVLQLLMEQKEKYPASWAFIMLLILTGARRGEIASARWRDLQGSKLVLQTHKTDHTGDDRVIHFPKLAMEILAELPNTGPNERIIGIESPRKLWDSARKKAGCPDLRLHDLRHSFASIAISSGYNLSQIGELLGHRDADTTKRYAHLMDDAAALVAESVADSITNQSNENNAFKVAK
ncbi:MAG: tyrosine-type recombinase/integrase [Desulfobulbus sp.]